MSALPVWARVINLFSLLYLFIYFAEARLGWVEEGMLSKYHLIKLLTFGVYVYKSIIGVERDSC